MEGRGECDMTADLAGDYRDEVVCIESEKQGGDGFAVLVYSNTETAKTREAGRTDEREYRLWLARNYTGGYPTYFEWQPSVPVR